MVAKPKLSAEQWANARQVWEADSRKGFPWLVEQLGLPVSAEAVRQRSKAEVWVKGGSTSLDAQPKLGPGNSKLGKGKAKLGEIQDKKPAEKPIATPEPEWEEVAEEPKNFGGRPTKYLPIYDRQAYHLCLLGATDTELAEFFMVSESTINLWKLNYITFSESVKAGKVMADSEAAASLFKRATGFRYKEVKTKQVRPMAADDGEGGIVAAGDDDLLVVEVVTTEKEVPPDTSAAFIWLKNRRPKDWRDKIEVENTTKLDPEILVRIKTEFVAKMAASRARQRQVLIERGYLDAGSNE